jgi:hypothetical protein
MKADIDHVLMFIQPGIYGEQLAFIVHRELKISIASAMEQLKDRGRFYAPEGASVPFDKSRLRNFRGRVA